MRRASLLVTAISLYVAMAVPAAAYVGPGAGLSLLGALWGLVIAIAMAIGFILLWPFRRMLRKRKAAAQTTSGESDRTGDRPATSRPHAP